VKAISSIHNSRTQNVVTKDSLLPGTRGYSKENMSTKSWDFFKVCMTVHHLIRRIIEPTDATIIRCVFLELNHINLNMFRASLCPSSGEQEQD
jgi:hypothetical protein